MYTRMFLGHRIIAVHPVDALLSGFTSMISSIPQGCASALLNPTTNEQQIQIYVNYAVLELPSRVQEAIFAHEIGHIELGHLSPEIIRDMPRGGVIARLEFELAADAYAVRLGYGVELISLLEAFQRITKPSTNCFLPHRINALYQLVKEETNAPR